MRFGSWLVLQWVFAELDLQAVVDASPIVDVRDTEQVRALFEKYARGQPELSDGQFAGLLNAQRAADGLDTTFPVGFVEAVFFIAFTELTENAFLEKWPIYSVKRHMFWLSWITEFAETYGLPGPACMMTVTRRVCCRAPQGHPDYAQCFGTEATGYEFEQCCTFSEEELGTAAFATYVSPRRAAYVDGAVMLGLSLKRHAPGVPTLALIEEVTCSESERAELDHTLRNAGWRYLLSIPPLHPANAPEGIHFDGVYTKVMVFNPDLAGYFKHSDGVSFNRIVYLDADTWVRSPKIMELLKPDVLSPARPIAAVKDAGGAKLVEDASRGIFNSGVFVVMPNKDRFEDVMREMMVGYANDQPAINNIFEGEFSELPPAFNTHGHMVAQGQLSSSDAVIVHFTGSPKPTFANASHLMRVRRGVVSDRRYGLRGAGKLYAEFFEAMAAKEAQPFLSRGLLRAIREASLR